MYGSLDISVSGMIAQRTRMDAISANLAGKDSYTIDEHGDPHPFRRRMVMLAPGDPAARSRAGRELGVHVAEITESRSAPSFRWDPTHPYAYKTGDKQGYVPISDIDPMYETINSMEATRAYEANIVAAEATKSMMAQALRLIA
jgi:flagellar basal-body rod protein FlgC